MKKYLSVPICTAILLSVISVFGLTIGAENSVERYGATTITDTDVAYVYECLEKELTRAVPPERISLDGGSGNISLDELQKAFQLFTSDYPECFWVSSGYQYSHTEAGNVVSIIPSYTFSGEALTAARAELEAAIDEIMLALPSTDNYDKALYLHDVLARRVVYEEVGEHQTAYGALVAKKAVCAGYAAAYQLLLNRAGIMAWTVSGYSNKPETQERIPHAWNVIWLEDNACVYTDVTWNDNDDSELFHCYFNISKAEMEADHELNSEIFTLPQCNHGDRSYFDVNNGCNVNDSTTISQLAELFGQAEGNQRKAVVYYTGSSLQQFKEWISNNASELCNVLGCDKYESRSYKIESKSNELHITVVGTFVKATNYIKVNTPESINAVDYSEQYVQFGNALKDMLFTAGAGYYFPENYAVNGEFGVAVTRISSKLIKVFGTPVQDIVITLPQAEKMQKEQAPTAVYTSAGTRGGILSSVSSGMKYSFDGMEWIYIDSDKDIELTDISSGSIYVIRCGNGESTLDSDAQKIDVPVVVNESVDSGSDITAEKTEEAGAVAPKKTYGCGSAVEYELTAYIGAVSIALAVLVRKKSKK